MTDSTHEPVRTRFVASGISFVVGGAAALVLQIVAVRTLGAELYGQYATAIAVVALCELAALNRGGELALGALGSAWVSQRWDDISVLTPRLVRTDRSWAFGSFGVLVFIAFLPVFQQSFEPYWLLIAGIAIPSQIGYGADKAILIVSGKIATLATAEITVSLIGTSLAIVLLLEFGALGLVVAYAVAAAIKVVIVRRLASAIRRALPQRKADSALDSRNALPAQLTTTARNLVMAFVEQADIILLSAFAGPAAAGTYKVAKSLATFPARAVGPIWASLRPELVRYWFAADRSQLRSMMFRPTLLVLVAGFAAIPICWYFGTPTISRIYGIDGATVMPALTILLAGSWIYFGLAGWYRFLMLLDANKWRSLTWSVGQALWLVAVGALVASGGPIAMAVIVAVGQVAISALAVVWLVRSTKRPS